MLSYGETEGALGQGFLHRLPRHRARGRQIAEFIGILKRHEVSGSGSAFLKKYPKRERAGGTSSRKAAGIGIHVPKTTGGHLKLALKRKSETSVFEANICLIMAHCVEKNVCIEMR